MGGNKGRNNNGDIAVEVVVCSMHILAVFAGIFEAPNNIYDTD